MSQEGSPSSVFSSHALDSALEDKDLKTSYKVPQSAAAQFISEQTTGMPLTEEQHSMPTDVGLHVGLGLKRMKRKKDMGDISDMSDMLPSGEGHFLPQVKRTKKPKTKSEKRERLEEDLLKYGVAAIEKLYPKEEHRPLPQPTVKRKRGPKPGNRLKAKQSIGVEHFEEVDAQQILRPYSHDKYIHQPEVNSVVYIRRRKAFVPLSSLSKDSRTVLSSDAKLLAGRNVSYGKPSLFVKERERVIAIGGSRNKENDFLKVIPVPDIKSRLARSQSALNFVPFCMDEGFASFAVSAIHTPKKKPKIDIRALKRIQRKESVELKEVLKEKSIVDHVYDKMKSASEALEEEKTRFSKEDSKKETEKGEDRLILSDDSEEEEKENKNKNGEDEPSKIFSRLLDSTSTFVNPLPDPEGCPVTSSEFKDALKERNNKELTGYENCDIEDCFCRDSYALMEISTPATDGTRTPESNIPTPIENKGQHVVKNLKKVKRALKTLGVNLVEFDAQNGLKKDCDKDFCGLGCICDTLVGNPVVPNHCSKVECMFRCHCSEETLKKLSSSRKVAISPSAYTNFQDKSPTNVVTTGGRDLIMIAGRQKRERKMPTRYQDTDALTLESVSPEFMSKSEDVFNLDNILVPGRGDPNIVKMISNGVRERISRKCTVLVPKINLSPEFPVKPWCMFHCRHSCPCFKYENPLDYGPDLSKSRNVARRSSKLVSLICLDDDELEGVEKAPSKQYSIRRDQCARTEGISINPSFKLKMPHKFVTVKEAVEAETNGDIITLRFPNDDKKTVIDLTLKPSKSIQYIQWYVLHYIFTHNIVRIWYFTRNGKFVFFISRFSSPPCVKNSNNVKDLIRHTTDLSNLPIFARELMSTKTCERNSQKFAILTSSGISWEITGILQKKADRSTTPQNKPNAEQSVVNLELSKQKLNLGQDLVTVVQSDKAVIQIKLPATSPNQYWYTLRVPHGVDSVPCPEISIALKTATIKQAADLANSENTTVRIPIDASVGSSSFGIYAVPCLDKHVFIGPFTVKEFNSPPEIICIGKEEEDIATIIPPPKSSNSGCRRKQKLTTKYDEIDRINNEKIVTTLVESVADRAVVFGERRRKQQLFAYQPVLGSVPEVISSTTNTGDVSVIDDDQETILQSDILKETFRNNEEVPGYRNLPKSEYGIIVRGEIDKSLGTYFEIDVPNQGQFKAFKSSSRTEQIQFHHPSFPKHIVMCKNMDNARKWVEEYAKGTPEATQTLTSPKDSKKRLNMPSLTEEQRLEYIQLFFRLRKSLVPEHDASLVYNRLQVIDYAKDLIVDLKKKMKSQENMKKELLTRRSYLLDEFTSKLKGLPIDMKKKLVYDLKIGLKNKKPEAPVKRETSPAKSPNNNSPKKNNMPALIPISKEKSKCQQDLTVSAPKTPNSHAASDERKNRKPLNAFMLWAKKQRPKLVSSGLTTVELSRMLVDKWHQLSQDERKQYQLEAERLKKLNSSQESSDVTELKIPKTIKKEATDSNDDSVIVLDEKPIRKNPSIIEISLD